MQVKFPSGLKSLIGGPRGQLWGTQPTYATDAPVATDEGLISSARKRFGRLPSSPLAIPIRSADHILCTFARCV